MSLLPQRIESAAAGPANARAAASVIIPDVVFVMAPTCLAAGERRLKPQDFNVNRAADGTKPVSTIISLSLAGAAEWPAHGEKPPRSRLRTPAFGPRERPRARRAFRRPERRRAGGAPGHARRADLESATPPGARVGFDPPARHDGLLGGPDRARDPAVPERLGAAAVPVRHPPVRLQRTRRRAPVGDQHALRDQGRWRDPDRALRQLQHRPHEARLPGRPRPALRADDAGDLGRALQLLLPGPALAGARGRGRLEAARPGPRRRRLLCAPAELPPLRVDDPVPVRVSPA